MNNIKRFFSYYKPYKAIFTVVLLSAFALSLISLLFPMIIRYATKELEVGNVSIIVPVVTGMLLLVLIYTAASFYLSYQGHMMGARIENDMRKELFSHYQDLSLDFYDNHKVGSLMSRITGDLYNIGELAHHGPEDMVMTSVSFVGALILMLLINVKLALILFALIPLIFIYALVMSQRMGKQYGVNRGIMSDMNASIEESLSGIRVVKSFANEDHEKAMFAELGNTFIEGKKAFYRSEILFYEGLDGFITAMPAILLAFGGFALYMNAIDLADLLAFFLLMSNFTNPILKFMHSMLLFQDGASGFKRFLEFMDIEPNIKEKDRAIVLGTVDGNIEFEHVSFCYDDGIINVLDDINFEVNSGEFVALVGASGSGKSTLTSLLPRFYDVTHGAIRIDGVDVRDVTFDSLRNNIGIVQQEVYLFSGTIYENIAYAKHDASMDDVIAAAKQANAHDFIMSLPNGYQTDIGHRGVKLSGGQRQRLSIARVFLKNPPVLIFDEATSSLDNESERVVQEAMETLAANRTTIVIAHRLSTIRNAKRIIVLDDHKIAETGDHESLIRQEGVYASLYNAQY
ncbi:ABC transporter ATP-binding protein [Erysipelothrix anatis]|uniref:ABC transporter ATP-binding protein n=1 Tax=Erysipelothrix anatis TaxID=2683713 RepID=UPI00135AA419|nr:ABC transporter ATP-binding protein [Erysipelothrix anatis]